MQHVGGFIWSSQNIVHYKGISGEGDKGVIFFTGLRNRVIYFSFRLFSLHPISYTVNEKFSVSLSMLFEHQQLSLVFGTNPIRISILFKVISAVWTIASAVT